MPYLKPRGYGNLHDVANTRLCRTGGTIPTRRLFLNHANLCNPINNGYYRPSYFHPLKQLQNNPYYAADKH